MPDQNPVSGAKPNYSVSRTLRRQTRTKQFDPKAIESLTENLKQSLGLGIKGKLNCTDVLTDFDKKRITKAEHLDQPEVEKGKLGTVLKKADKDNDPLSYEVRESIDNEALNETPQFNEASKKFNKIIDTINQRAQKTPPDLDPGITAQLLNAEKGTMVEAMKAQFKHENEGLSRLAKDPDFKNKVINGLGVKESEYDSFMRNIQANVRQKQDAQLKAFEKSMNKQIISLHNQNQAEKKRVAAISNLVKNNERARKFVGDEIGEEALKRTLDENEPESGALLTFKLEQFADAGLLTNLSGRKIDYDKSTDTFQYKFPNNSIFHWPHNTLKNWIYNHRREDMGRNDMRGIAEAVKACGHESIVMTVDNPDPDNANEMAKMAYEAARQSGFPPDKITIKVNGPDQKSGKKSAKEVKIDELFKDDPKWKEQIEESAQKIADQWESRSNALPEEDFKKMKEQVADLRQQLIDEPDPDAAPNLNT